ncbi:MAG TPA: triose-phosphate isomerase [Rhizomicrobium sp.]|nr:triose-phosphate isomerase [Rhizomicrobium sp.]
MRQLIAGNWKMNGLAANLGELAALKAGLDNQEGDPDCDVLICPPATLIAQAAWAVKGAFALGGQDCSAKPSGAFTGDISAQMLKDAGAAFVILGHSERRQIHGERDADIAAKVEAAWAAGLTAIICIGESGDEREAGRAHAICLGQIGGSVPKTANAANTAIAYEPVWAIGTGKTPTLEEITAMHAHLHGCLVEKLGEAGRAIRLLYGGSVNPKNARDILNLDGVDGALVGGASLKASDFLAIIGAVKQP